MKQVKTLSPVRRKGSYVPDDIYRDMREFILNTLKKGPVSLNHLLERAAREMKMEWDDSLNWYVLQVKHDLEARGLIKVKIGLGPHRTQLIYRSRTRTIL